MALKGKTWVSGDSWRRGVAPHCPPCPWAPCQGPLPSPSSPAVPELFDILQQSPLLLSQESWGKAGAELVYTRVWLTDVCPSTCSPWEMPALQSRALGTSKE